MCPVASIPNSKSESLAETEFIVSVGTDGGASSFLSGSESQGAKRATFANENIIPQRLRDKQENLPPR
jgi:hypothetical protein